MEKKEYIKPEMNVYQMETQAILAGSKIKIAADDDYSEESVSDYRDGSGSILADRQKPHPQPLSTREGSI